VNPVRNSSPAIAGLETDGPFMNIRRSRELPKFSLRKRRHITDKFLFDEPIVICHDK
jgi:hypothetical protein